MTRCLPPTGRRRRGPALTPSGRWDGDALVIEAVNFNGYAKLGTIGHSMSDQATLTMTFRRPDYGRIQFTWVLDDPKTYTRPISNDRVFVLTPNVEIMEYACMEASSRRRCEWTSVT